MRKLLCLLFCLRPGDEMKGLNHRELFRNEQLSVRCHSLSTQGPVVTAVAYVSAAV